MQATDSLPPFHLQTHGLRQGATGVAVAARPSERRAATDTTRASCLARAATIVVVVRWGSADGPRVPAEVDALHLSRGDGGR